MQGSRSYCIHSGIFEFKGTNNTESCTPSARCSQVQPIEPLLAHVLVKPIYWQAVCALKNLGQVGGKRGEVVKNCNSGLGGKLKNTP